ncbi:hypothetical protein [Acinetobacter lactucae]|uniref:hypothetical protein n=1 Tax=Acinetobacter lactucae TaxID=1785128 RepID=UPI0003DF8977|nr:hypothetical protein [Acinetobacter lactucae]ETR94506.1 hypothetical protein M211_2218 [Acinetobacter lactucae]
MDKCREEFESLPLVSDWIDEVFFEQRHDEYQGGEDFGRGWVNGAWEMFQHQQAKVEELQEEFAEDERFLKEQIKDKDLKIENLEYLQGMDKEHIQTLQSKNEKLQKRVDACKKLLEKWKTMGLNGTSDYAVGGAHMRQNCEEDLEQALKGGYE